MTDTIFGVIAQEEMLPNIAESDSVEYAVTVESAIEAIEDADKSEDLIFEADKFADRVQSAISVEETILKDGEVSKEVAKMAAATTVILAKEQGFPTVMSMEDDVTDPSSTMVVAIEEKRNIVKRVYDSVVVFFKKFVNMIKKAFAKVVMTLNGNEGALKKLKKKFEGLKNNKYTIKKDDVEAIFGKYTTYTWNTSAMATFTSYAANILDKSSEVVSIIEKEFDIKDTIVNYVTIRRPFIETFKEIQDYVGTKKTSLFGDTYEGKITVNIISYTGSYVRCIVAGGIEDDKPFVKVKKVKLNSGDNLSDSVLMKMNYINLIEKAISANKNIKKFTDSAFKNANKALEKSSKLAKTADKNDNADDASTKLTIMYAKVFGTAGYGIAMDRYKVIREVIKIGYSTIDTIKENEKEAKKDSTNS